MSKTEKLQWKTDKLFFVSNIAVKGIDSNGRETTVYEKDQKTLLFDSKFGGVPYWDLSKGYPINKNGTRNLESQPLSYKIMHLCLKAHL